MPKLLALVLAAAVVAVPAVVAQGAAIKNVRVDDNFYVRPDGVPTVTVDKGTKVRWNWRGDSLHDVKVTRGPVIFGSDRMTSGSYVKRLTRRGTYTLVCTIHGPRDQKMKLVVR